MKESPTKLVLGVTGLVGALAALSFLLPLGWFLIVSIFLTYEFWTLFNKYPNDTLSEGVWKYRKRSILPLMVGILIGVLGRADFFGAWEPFMRGLCVGGLLGHFFWPPEQEEA